MELTIKLASIAVAPLVLCLIVWRVTARGYHLKLRGKSVELEIHPGERSGGHQLSGRTDR
jgi:hypothetical protein